jgi:hypothetical protein
VCSGFRLNLANLLLLTNSAPAILQLLNLGIACKELTTMRRKSVSIILATLTKPSRKSEIIAFVLSNIRRQTQGVLSGEIFDLIGSITSMSRNIICIVMLR